MDRDIAWVLAEIRRQNSINGKLKEIGYFEFEEGPNIPSPTQQETIATGYLQRKGVLVVIKKTTRQAFVKHEYGGDLMAIDDGIEIEINVAKFEELEASLAQKIPPRDGSQRVHLLASERNGISRKDGRGEQYEIRGNRKMIFFLLIKGGPIKSSVFQKKFNYMSSRVTGEINKINETFRKKLSLADPIIERSASSGYSINTKIFDIEFE